MTAWVISLFTSGVLTKLWGWAQSLLGVVANTEVTKLTTAAQVDVAIQGYARDMAVADKGWWLTAAMKPVCFYTFMLHVGAIVLDTTFKLHWGIPKLPEPYGTLEANVIYLCLGIAGAYGISRIIRK